MGDIADMMLDGTLCEGCGEYMGEASDFPRLCAACANDRRKAGHKIEHLGEFGFVDAGMKNKKGPTPKKIKCPDCGKRVKEIGLADHRRDVHKVIL